MVSPNLTRGATLGRHTASVSIVKWGGADVLYTTSNDRPARVWDRRPLRTLKDPAHWVTTLASRLALFYVRIRTTMQ